jgi:PHP family Zn ribbon phosphoesterase
MYGLDYNDEPIVVSDLLGFQIDVYRLASYYNVPRLQSLALKKIQNYYNNKEDWNKDEFLQALNKEWYSNDEIVRKFLMETCYTHINELSKDEICQAILRNNPDLAVALVYRLGQYLEKYYCSECKEIWAFDMDASSSFPAHCPICGHEEEYWGDYLQ